jgi:hypothetical protein
VKKLRKERLNDLDGGVKRQTGFDAGIAPDVVLSNFTPSIL